MIFKLNSWAREFVFVGLIEMSTLLQPWSCSCLFVFLVSAKKLRIVFMYCSVILNRVLYAQLRIVCYCFILLSLSYLLFLLCACITLKNVKIDLFCFSDRP